MTLADLQSDMVVSLKKGDRNRVETLRFLIAAVRNAGIAKYGSASDTSLTESDILEVIKKQVKTHKESVDAFTKAGRQELIQKEQGEMDILSAFLPKELSDEQLRVLVADVVNSADPSLRTGQGFGLLMKSAMANVGGRADGGRVAGMLKEMLHV